MKKPKVLTGGRKVLFALLAAVVGVSANLQATPAHAAELQAINADSITLTNESRGGQNLEVNDFARIEASWSVPDQTAHAGDTFTLGLPAVLQGRSGNFNLTPEGADAPVYGTCAVQAEQVLCTLSAEVEGKSNVGGKLWVSAQVKGEHGSNTLTFNVNGNTPKEVPLPNNAPNIGYNPYTPDEVRKFGYFTDEKELTWRIVVPGNVLAGQNKLTIHDPYANPGANFTVKTASFYKTPKTPKCWNDAWADGCMTELWSKEGASTDGVNINYDDAIDKIVADVNGPFEANAIYTLHLVLTVDGDVPPGSEYVNNATVNGQVVSETATKEASGGGTGSGDALGQIQLVKAITGNHNVPGDTVFPVKFSFQRAGQEITGTLELKADGTPVVLRNIVNGTQVTFTEELPAVAGTTFGDPVFSGEGVTDGGAASASATVTAQGTKKLELTLTNPVEPPPALEKVVPVSPTLTAGVCTPGSATPSDPTVTLANTEGILYDQSISPKTPENKVYVVEVRATPQAGKQLDADNLPQGWAMNQDGSATFTGEITQPDCPTPPTTVVPVAPTTAVGTCEPGAVEPTDPTITAADTEGITYSTSWAVDGDEIVFTATATAKPGFDIDPVNLPEGWTWNKDKDLAEYTKRVAKPVCAKPAVPVAPTVTPGVCTPGSTAPSNPTVEVATTEGITYGDPVLTKDGRNVTVTVTATRKDGFLIDGGNLPQGWVYNNDGTATFTTTVEQPVCEATKVIPVSPTLTPGVCEPGATEATRPTVTAATTDGISYTSPAVNQVGTSTAYKIIMTARPKDGYTLDLDNLPEGWTKNLDGVSANFTGTVTNPVCELPKVTPVDPTITPGACTPGSLTRSEPTVEVPTTEGITYGKPEITIQSGKAIITVTATPADGKQLVADLPENWVKDPNSEQAIYTKIIDHPACEATKVTPVAPAVTPGVCTPGSTTPTDPTVELPATEGITYGKPEFTVEGRKVTVTVTATANEAFTIDGDKLTEGWKLNADGTATYTTTVAQPNCEVPTPPAPVEPLKPVDPKITPGVCKPGSKTPTPPRVELPKVPGLVYGTPMMTVVGNKVTVTVTVVPDAGKKIGDLGKGWTLNQDGSATYTYTGVNPVCGKPGMPKTGA